MKEGDLEKTKDTIARGANLNCRVFWTSDTPLHLACIRRRADIVAELLLHGADVEATSEVTKSTPLVDAAACEAEAVVRQLIDAGADVGARDIYGRTALHRASETLNHAIVKMLLDAGADVDCKNGSGDQTLLDRVLARNVEEESKDAFVKLLRERGGKTRNELALEKAPWIKLMARVLDRTTEHLEKRNDGRKEYVPPKPEALRRRNP